MHKTTSNHEQAAHQLYFKFKPHKDTTGRKQVKARGVRWKKMEFEESTKKKWKDQARQAQAGSRWWWKAEIEGTKRAKGKEIPASIKAQARPGLLPLFLLYFSTSPLPFFSFSPSPSSPTPRGCSCSSSSSSSSSSTSLVPHTTAAAAAAFCSIPFRHSAEHLARAPPRPGWDSWVGLGGSGCGAGGGDGVIARALWRGGGRERGRGGGGDGEGGARRGGGVRGGDLRDRRGARGAQGVGAGAVAAGGGAAAGVRGGVCHAAREAAPGRGRHGRRDARRPRVRWRQQAQDAAHLRRRAPQRVRPPPHHRGSLRLAWSSSSPRDSSMTFIYRLHLFVSFAES